MDAALGRSGARARPVVRKPAPKAKPSEPRVSKLNAARRLEIPWRLLILVLGAGAAAMAAAAFLATDGRGAALEAYALRARDTHLASLGFRLRELHLQGASAAAEKEIFAAANLKMGGPILDTDLDAVRRRVESVGWVARARVVRLLPDTLVIAVYERPLMAVWQVNGGFHVVAENGAILAQMDPARFEALPLIVGEGANVSAREILPLIARRTRLSKATDALVRVDQRRWDILLKNGTRIMLPAGDAEPALKRLDALDAQARILDLSFERLDLRDPAKIIVRPRSAPSQRINDERSDGEARGAQ